MRKSIIVVAIAVSAIFAGCTDSKYKVVGPPEFNVEILYTKTDTISPGKIVSTHTVTGLTVNSHTIKIAPSVPSSENRFEAETEGHGTIQFSVEGSGRSTFLSLRLTKEQQESILALGSPTDQFSAAPEEVTECDKSVAVLPFLTMGSDPEHEGFSDMFTQELLHKLSKVPQLHVTDHMLSFAYKGKGMSITDMSGELQVAYVVEGSVRKSEDRVRIATQLIRAEDDSHLWSYAYDRALDEIPVVQEEIIAAVVGQINDPKRCGHGAAL